MKIRITENQYDLIKRYINEARKEPKPVSLKSFFNTNKDAQFFAVTQRDKGGSEGDYDFKIGDVNGHMVLTDINKNTTTKTCTGDIRLDTMIYGNQFKLNFGSCKKDLTINNVVGVKLFKDENTLKSNSPMDTLKIEHEFDVSVDEFAKKYNDEIKSVNIGDEVHFDLKVNNKSVKYDGEVINKMGPNLQIEILKPNTDEMLFNLNVNIGEDPFYIQDGELFFKGKTTKKDESEKEFNASVIKFFIDAKQGGKKDDKSGDNEQDKLGKDILNGKSEEEFRAEAKIAMDMILNDPLLKKAFYRQPSFFELLKAELTGKKAVGKGILPTLQIVGDYKNREMDTKLGATFKEKEIVDYKLDNRVILPYTTQSGEENFVLEADTNYRVYVAKSDFAGNRKLVSYTDDTKSKVNYTIEILNPTDKDNIYRCKFTKEGGSKPVEALVEFIPRTDSNYGYKPKPKEKQQPATQQATQQPATQQAATQPKTA